jgi:hypothetical protein
MMPSTTCFDASGDPDQIIIETAFFRINANAFTFIARFSIEIRPIPYSREALWQDLSRVRVAWEDAQSDRSRDAIYGYLSAVYALVTWWAAEGQDVVRAQRAVRYAGLVPLSHKPESVGRM